MPSITHEALLELFRNRPRLAAEVLAERLPQAARSSRVEIVDSSLTETVPVERAADLVLLFSDDGAKRPRLAVVIEVQLAVDAEKHWSWWSYLTSTRSRHRCDASLVVVTPSARVARWAAHPIRIGHADVALVPHVIGPEQIPVIRDAAEAQANPELAVLSAVAHGRSDVAGDVARAAFAAVAPLDELRSRLYLDVVGASLAAAARQLLEDLMANGGYQYQSPFAKRYYGQGRAEGYGSAVLHVLEERHIAVDEHARTRILACTDVAKLEMWHRRAVHAKTIADVLGE